MYVATCGRARNFRSAGESRWSVMCYVRFTWIIDVVSLCRIHDDLFQLRSNPWNVWGCVYFMSYRSIITYALGKLN